MMKKQMQKAVCLLLGSVLLLSMGACGKKDKTSARDVTDGSSVTATQTTQVVREIKSHKGEIGEDIMVHGGRWKKQLMQGSSGLLVFPISTRRELWI